MFDMGSKGRERPTVNYAIQNRGSELKDFPYGCAIPARGMRVAILTIVPD